jgi:hypothetical protein
MGCASPAERDAVRDLSGLISQLIGLEGERIEAHYPAADGFAAWSQRFYIGISTGLRPCHLQLSCRNSKDGPQVYRPPGTTFRQIGKRNDKSQPGGASGWTAGPTPAHSRHQHQFQCTPDGYRLAD